MLYMTSPERPAEIFWFEASLWRFSGELNIGYDKGIHLQKSDKFAILQ